ncbi:UNVERIFIED_CONTAM: 8-hydroxygeraniol dehydrogenase [Sesamum radiatum]|uniref:8-hydroxygeraniol dehydrogenase n=1 Tax=Sesamum radiatum TaxID=300843 RepID=A0AAW2PYR1_SESRA
MPFVPYAFKLNKLYTHLVALHHPGNTVVVFSSLLECRKTNNNGRISEGVRLGRQRPVRRSLSFRLLQTPPARDVQFKVLYCGICHSDLHAVKNHWGFSTYPMLPGHESSGVVTEVGSKVQKFRPLRYYGLDKPGLHIGVVGLGGLGHVAVKFAKDFGSRVTVISTAVGKKKEALESLGADAFLVSRDPAEMQVVAGTLDGIIDTVFTSRNRAIVKLVEAAREADYIGGAGEAS